MTSDVLLVSAGGIAALFAALWLVSLALRDVSIVDIAWGPGFAVVAWIAYAVGDGSDDRRLLLALLVTLWGGRLGAHLARRNLGHGEDPRYVAMRRRNPNFALRSLGTVFLLQATLMWIVSLPVQVAAVDATPAGLTVLDWIGAAVWALGLTFEAVGDAQLTRFRGDPANQGQVMDRGLWRYTRHPNYFGDFCVWWGLYLVALSSGSAWWTAVGPLVMTVLLTRVSGKGLLERSIGKRRPGYAEYVQRTSGFFPRPPRG